MHAFFVASCLRLWYMIFNSNFCRICCRVELNSRECGWRLIKGKICSHIDANQFANIFPSLSGRQMLTDDRFLMLLSSFMHVSIWKSKWKNVWYYSSYILYIPISWFICAISTFSRFTADRNWTPVGWNQLIKIYYKEQICLFSFSSLANILDTNIFIKHVQHLITIRLSCDLFHIFFEDPQILMNLRILKSWKF